VNCKNTEVKNAYICTFNKIFDNSLLNPNTILVISDTSIKNNVVTLISHICSSQNILAKTIHHVKIVDGGLHLFFFLSFYFSLSFIFYFLFLEQLRLGVISHTVTSVTNWWHSHKTDHGTWENEVEGSRTKWHHTAWTTYAGLMLYSWSFRIGCTVVSTDHEW